jgi:hypothetical protein
MSRPFDPAPEIADAKKFKTLASLFEKPDTVAIMERFAILAALSEGKAKILAELDEDIILSDNEPVGKNKGEVIESPTIADLRKKRRLRTRIFKKPHGWDSTGPFGLPY